MIWRHYCADFSGCHHNNGRRDLQSPLPVWDTTIALKQFQQQQQGVGPAAVQLKTKAPKCDPAQHTVQLKGKERFISWAGGWTTITSTGFIPTCRGRRAVPAVAEPKKFEFWLVYPRLTLSGFPSLLLLQLFGSLPKKEKKSREMWENILTIGRQTRLECKVVGGVWKY
jgi:hypothetical protein